MADSKYHIELDADAAGTSHGMMLELVGANKRVLDVGCATGYLAKALAELGNTVSGVEYDAVAAEQARPHLAELVVADLEAVDLVASFGRGRFDVVVFGDVLEHLRNPLPVLRQARPLLAPHGSVVISVPNIAHGDVRLALLSGRFEYRKLGLLDETHTRFFTKNSLDVFLRDAGFLAVDIRRTVAPLFGTELGVRAEDYLPAVIEQLRADPEATTYQFVLRAVPDDTLALDVQLTARLEQQGRRIAQLERDNDQLRGQLSAARAEYAAAAEAHTGDLAAVRRQVDELTAELHRMRHTRLWRAARLPRALYGTLRNRH